MSIVRNPDGTTTVDLPDGHTATLADPVNVPVRRNRPLQVIAARLGTKRFEQLKSVLGDGTTDEDEAEAVAQLEAMDLSESDYDALLRMTDASVYALLESWTLDRPIPDSPDALTDLPQPVYDALAAAAQAVQSVHRAEGALEFGDLADPGAIDPEAPTSASAS